MGLTRREAARRLDAVIEFAELEEFAELKLKNYSSGMMVRLAFAIMVQADADIMLIDEVLAVGDAAFAQKCMDVFHERRDGRARRSCWSPTTWPPCSRCATGRCCCTRASSTTSASAEDAALRYYRLNFGRTEAAAESDAGGAGRRVVDAQRARGRRQAARRGRAARSRTSSRACPIVVDVVFEAARDLAGPIFVFHVVNDDGVVVCAFTRRARRSASRPGSASGSAWPDREPPRRRALLPRLLDPPGRQRERDGPAGACGCCASSCSARRRATGWSRFEADVEAEVDEP